MTPKAPLTAMAYDAFRAGAVSPRLQAFARDQIERRGLRPAIDRIEAQIAKAFRIQKENERAL